MTQASDIRSHYWYILSFCILFLQVLPSQLNAQLNIKTGYSLSYIDNEVANDIINSFNNRNKDWLDNQLNEIHWMHGLHLGLRYRIEDIVGVELGWATKFDNIDTEGTDPISQELFYRKFIYQQNQINFGLESIIADRFGFGGSIDYNLISIKSRHEKKGNKIKVVKDNTWSSNFFITYYTVPSNGVGFAIRPYMRVPWTEINYRGLANDLNEESETNQLKDKSLQFGITLLFFNGN